MVCTPVSVDRKMTHFKKPSNNLWCPPLPQNPHHPNRKAKNFRNQFFNAAKND
jgi:hypothetical protein